MYMNDYETASTKRYSSSNMSKESWENGGMCRIDDIFPVSSRFFRRRGLAQPYH